MSIFINVFLLTLIITDNLVLGFISGPLVSTPSGDIRGYFLETRGGRRVAAYTSIPFAEPPIGELRFEGPVPIKPWRDVLNATKLSPKCVQRNPYTREKSISGQEDCLYLNVYSPYIPNESNKVKRLPVMVWMHGGGWMCGDSSTPLYGPKFLLDRDVILVAINYRLGPLGFLSTQDKYCPGNNGLKDQQEALRWIQNNIHAFGGDKNSVTLFGESAGGASVHFHMLSQTSAGLFHKAISQSGTALVPWAESQPGEAQKKAILLSKLLSCPEAPSNRFIECLRTKDSYDIIDTEYDFYAWDYEPMTPFKAVVEPDLPGAFLTKPLRSISNVFTVPWMTGLTSDEGCLKSVWITSNETRYSEFANGFDSIAPITFYYENSPQVEFITNSIRRNYLNENRGALTNKEKQGIMDIYTDNYFAYPAVEAVELLLNHTKNPIYLYELSYRATNSFSEIFGDPHNDYGVCHADDIMHLFPVRFLLKPNTEKDIEISKLIVDMWTNFATTGNPNKPVPIPTEWKPVSNAITMEYFNIGNNLYMKKDFASRSRFWEKMPLWHNQQNTRLIDEL